MILTDGAPILFVKGVLSMRCKHCAQVIVRIDDDQWFHLDDPPLMDGKIVLRIRCNNKAYYWLERAEPYELTEIFG